MHSATLIGKNSSENRNDPGRFLLAIGVVEMAFAALASIWIDEKPAFVLYLASFFGWSVVYLIACFAALRQAPSARQRFWVIAIVAVAMRAVILPSVPTLSDDIFRYRWDGRVQTDGTNPYLFPPEAAALSHLRDSQYPGINNKDIRTIYPPLSQFIFRLPASLGFGITGLKAVFVVFDVALVGVLIGFLRAIGLNPNRALIYAWNPLVVTEISGSGHNDVAAVLLLILGQWAIIRHRQMLSMVLVGLCGSTKILGFLLAPLWWRRVRLRDYAAMILISSLLTLPFVTAGQALFDGLTQYATRWRANDGLYHILFWMTGSLDLSKMIVAGVLVSSTLWLVYRRAAPLRSTYWITGAMLLLTATLHPWYLLWIVPYLCVYPSPMWLGLSATVALAYHAPYISLPGEPWQELIWIKWLEYAPLLCLGAVGWIRAIATSSSDEARPSAMAQS